LPCIITSVHPEYAPIGGGKQKIAKAIQVKFIGMAEWGGVGGNTKILSRVVFIGYFIAKIHIGYQPINAIIKFYQCLLPGILVVPGSFFTIPGKMSLSIAHYLLIIITTAQHYSVKVPGLTHTGKQHQ
jgi:hypothetical protein